jgi:GAF domain-containing protein
MMTKSLLSQEPPTPVDEPGRLRALHRLQVLDTPREAMFDRLVAVAAQLFETPIALLNLVAAHRQWAKATFGLDFCQSDRRDAFCTHTILESDPLVVEDPLTDERFARNPLVLAEPGIRFYAGAPVRTSDGYHVGSLCVIDRTPRTCTADQCDALQHLAQIAAAQMETRRAGEHLAKSA